MENERKKVVFLGDPEVIFFAEHWSSQRYDIVYCERIEKNSDLSWFNSHKMVEKIKAQSSTFVAALVDNTTKQYAKLLKDSGYANPIVGINFGTMNIPAADVTLTGTVTGDRVTDCLDQLLSQR